MTAPLEYGFATPTTSVERSGSDSARKRTAERLYIPLTYSCGGCDTRWPGVSRAHCSGCHETFNGFGLFDRHRRERNGEGYCLDPAAIVSPKTHEREMYLTDGIWQSVENPTKGAAMAKARAARGKS